MISLILWIIIFVSALTLLVKSSDWFTDAAERIGVSLRLSPFIVGVTIVAIGTSLPELVSSIVAVLAGAPEIVIGNVIGSNITNILLIIGVTGIIAKKLIIARELIKVDLPLLIGSAFLAGFMLIDGTFSRFDALLSIALLVVYLLFTFTSEKHSDTEIKKEFHAEEQAIHKELRHRFIWRDWAALIISGGLIYLSAHYTIQSVINIATSTNYGTDIIAATAVALGTSLPELSVSIAAAKKHKAEMAIGNILGSNIFNTLAVLSVPALIKPLSANGTILAFGLPVMIAVSLLYLFITQDRELTKWEGWLLIIFYFFFIVKLITG